MSSSSSDIAEWCKDVQETVVVVLRTTGICVGTGNSGSKRSSGSNGKLASESSDSGIEAFRFPFWLDELIVDMDTGIRLLRTNSLRTVECPTPKK